MVVNVPVQTPGFAEIGVTPPPNMPPCVGWLFRTGRGWEIPPTVPATARTERRPRLQRTSTNIAYCSTEVYPHFELPYHGSVQLMHVLGHRPEDARSIRMNKNIRIGGPGR